MNYESNTDIDHFNNLQPPLSPNADEVAIFKSEIANTPYGYGSLLLGYTKELLPICDFAMDLNPPRETRYHSVIRENWFDIDENRYDVIVGDGVLNLVGGELVQHLSTRCNKLVIRFFTHKLPQMKYATLFRHNTNFLLPDQIIETQPYCKILIWKFGT